MLNKKDVRMDGEGDDDDGFALTPRTEEKYRKIDDDFRKAMEQGAVSILEWSLLHFWF